MNTATSSLGFHFAEVSGLLVFSTVPTGATSVDPERENQAVRGKFRVRVFCDFRFVRVVRWRLPFSEELMSVNQCLCSVLSLLMISDLVGANDQYFPPRDSVRRLDSPGKVPKTVQPTLEVAGFLPRACLALL